VSLSSISNFVDFKKPKNIIKMRLLLGRMKMSLFDYSTPNMLKVLIWEIDKHGFVQAEIVDLEL